MNTPANLHRPCPYPSSRLAGISSNSRAGSQNTSYLWVGTLPSTNTSLGLWATREQRCSFRPIPHLRLRPILRRTCNTSHSARSTRIASTPNTRLSTLTSILHPSWTLRLRQLQTKLMHTATLCHQNRRPRQHHGTMTPDIWWHHRHCSLCWSRTSSWLGFGGFRSHG